MVNFHQKLRVFGQNGRPELQTKLTKRSAERVRSNLAERLAEPFGFGRTLSVYRGSSTINSKPLKMLQCKNNGNVQYHILPVLSSLLNV